MRLPARSASSRTPDGRADRHEQRIVELEKCRRKIHHGDPRWFDAEECHIASAGLQTGNRVLGRRIFDNPRHNAELSGKGAHDLNSDKSSADAANARGILGVLRQEQRETNGAGRRKRGDPRIGRWHAWCLPLAGLGEKLFAIGETVRLEKEAEQNCAVGRHRLVLIAGRPPDELAGAALAFVIFQRAFDHVGLLQRGVLVQWHHGAGLELEQRRGNSVAVGIEHLDLDAGEFGLLPRQVRRIDKVRGAVRRIVGLDVGMHDLAGWRGHGCLLG